VERTVTPAPAAPSTFNPDPGTPPPMVVEDPVPFFQPEVPLPKSPEPDAVDYPTHVYQLRPITEPGPLTSDPLMVAPLQSDFPSPLPRNGVRSNEFIPADHGHGWEAPEDYPLSLQGQGYPAYAKPVPNRWTDAHFVPWKRYTSGDINPNETPFAYSSPEMWHWYRQSRLKGDLPIHGQDWFLALSLSSETLFEDRNLPIPSGISAALPGQFDFLGSYGTSLWVQNVALDMTLLQGETVFKPPQQMFKVRLVNNYNEVDLDAPGILNPDVGLPVTDGEESPTRRKDDFFALQEAFYEYHIADLTPNYDFLSVKAGLQPFNSDFRGFIFNDTQLGVRLLGNQDNNRTQYNLALFNLLEKDTNSELNTLDARNQIVMVANLYRQDFLVKGYTTQVSVHGNFDNGASELYFDDNGFLVRPAPLGTVGPHDVRVGYLGWTGDGHIHRININHAHYWAFGEDELNGLAGRPVEISAGMTALELSYDRDWIRFKLSGLFATGDRDPYDDEATGFDSIVDNTNFIGGPFSYFVRQGFNLAGTAVATKQRFSVLPNLRTSKTQGQANFVNPGVLLFGAGSDIEITPHLRGFLNANHITFGCTEPIETALFTSEINPEFGWDLSLGLQWRPLLTDNIIISAGYAAFLPGNGFDEIYRNTEPILVGFGTTSPAPDDLLHSAIFAITLTY
jgi:hypothetical protein